MKPERSLAPATYVTHLPPAPSQLRCDTDGKPSAALAAPLGQEEKRKSQVKVFRLLYKVSAGVSI